MFTLEEKKARVEERRKARTEAKEQEQIEAEKNQRPIAKLKIIIEWKRSRMWGNNPSASVEIEYKQKNGNDYLRDEGFTCSGCGYDKESTVIAEIFNKYLKYKLYQKRSLKSNINGQEVNHPYGVYYYNGGTGPKMESGYTPKPSFNGGVGTSCYYHIAEFIGGKFEKVASGKTFDVYQYTDEKGK